MIDIGAQLDAIDREVTRRLGPDGEEVSVRIRRTVLRGPAGEGIRPYRGPPQERILAT